MFLPFESCLMRLFDKAVRQGFLTSCLVLEHYTMKSDWVKAVARPLEAVARPLEAVARPFEAVARAQS